MKYKIIPAIIAKNQKELNQRIKKIKPFVELIQLDIMDGQFVDNKSFNFNFKLPKNLKYEAHLMIQHPLEWIEKNYKKIDNIIVHIECLDRLSDIITFAKEKKKKIGFALNPESNIDMLEPYIFQLDKILIMTVNPGKYGSPFLFSTSRKVKKLRKLHASLNIEVDGSINEKTIKKLKSKGANEFVVGSYLQEAKNPKSAFNILERLIK